MISKSDYMLFLRQPAWLWLKKNDPSKLPPDTESKIYYANPAWLINGNPIVTYSRRKAGMCLMFWSGQSFDEPLLKPEGKFKAAEIIYTSVDEINEDDLIRWLRKSVDIQWDYKNLVKKRGVLDRLI